MTNLLHAETTAKAWRAYYNTYNAHGHDYPEAYFEEIMRLEFERMKVAYRTQVAYDVRYKGIKVGQHITDTELEEAVVLEYKVTPGLLPRHLAQLVSNLKASQKQVGLALNFGGDKPEGVRRVLTNQGEPGRPIWQPKTTPPHLLYPELTLALYLAVWNVYSELGAGFVYRIYTNATALELRQTGIAARRLRKMPVLHFDRLIGHITFHHLLVEGQMVLAPIARSTITQSDLNKVKHLLQFYGLRLGMIVNFANEKLEVRYVKG